MKDQLLFQSSYSEWATRRLLTACATLPPTDIDRDTGGSHATIRRTLYHFYISEEFWVKCLRENTLPRLADIGGDADPTPTSLGDMQRDWPAVWRDLREYLEGATEQEIADQLVGPDCRIHRWKLVLHLVNHATLHRGQVTSMLRQVGQKPPNTDIFTYALRDRS
jgi:uncharacterized damage-inducible protein DinB